MIEFLHRPLFVFLVFFLALWLAAVVGRHILRGQSKLDKELREDFGTIVTAALTLSALIVGFSFSMAINRYDQRKNYEEGEANAIGTEYVRVDLLPVADADKLRPLLKSYLEQRIAFYLVQDGPELQQVQARTAGLQAELWSAIRSAAAAQRDPVTALVVSGMNDVLNSQGYAQAMFWNRIPISAWALMVVVGILCNVLVGYGSRDLKTGSRLLPILPLIGAIAFMFIADIDAPRHGLIRVKPQNLTSLAESLRTNPPEQKPAGEPQK